MTAASLEQALDALGGAGRILLCTHVQPDGDAIGSLLALNILLRAMSRETMMLCQDPVPENLRLLPGWEEIRHPADAQGEHFDLGCSVDASDLERLGTAGKLFSICPDTLVIDHHASNAYFGRLNYVDSHVAASGNLVCRLFQAAGRPEVCRDAAICLYAAISSDTGNFSFGQMDEEFFLQLAQMMRTGFDITSAARALHLTRHRSHVLLLGRALNSLSFQCQGRLSGMKLTLRDFQELDAQREHAEGIVNYGLYVRGVEMSYLATQEEDGVKFSLRALPPHDVSQIALEFGGGGHLLASGCTMRLGMEEAISLMVRRMQAALEG